MIVYGCFDFVDGCFDFAIPFVDGLFMVVLMFWMVVYDFLIPFVDRLFIVVYRCFDFLDVLF